MIANLVAVLHVLSVFWLVSGILGRNLAHTMAVKAGDLSRLEARQEMASLFERAAVRPASFVVLATGLAAALLRGWPVLGFLQGTQIQWPLISLVVYLTIIPVIVLVFLPRGVVFRRALASARSEGRITEELKASLNDRSVAAARTYELFMVVALTFLMVAKPF